MPEEPLQCVPGNPALPGKPVVITRVGGFGAAEGSVNLVARDRNVERKGSMTSVKWTSEAIEATLPGRAPGGPPFYVEVTANGTTYRGPIDIRALTNDGSGYPPMH